jgi:hypothetical protein
MARRQKRRPYRPPTAQQRTEDAAQEQQRLDSAARMLMAGRTIEQLQAELQQREWLLSEADRLATLDPNPISLSRYRFARSQFNTVRAAIALLANAPG